MDEYLEYLFVTGELDKKDDDDEDDDSDDE